MLAPGNTCLSSQQPRHLDGLPLIAAGRRSDATGLQGARDASQRHNPACLYIADHGTRGFVRLGGVGRPGGACFAYRLGGDGTAKLFAPRLGRCQGGLGPLADSARLILCYGGQNVQG
jgi:hypothetical protein